MNDSSPAPAPAGDSEPGPPPSLPGAALWGDSDIPLRAGAAGAALANTLPKPSERAMPTIGHIGRYALKYRLGEGGIGTVYAAQDPLLSRLIAVKTLHVEINDAERDAFNALFLDEARAAGGLSHPHIVTVFDAGVSDKRAYIAMELLKGRDLRQLRQEGWRASPAQAVLIVRRVADALAFAHSRGVIHRDIKPANIFMVGRTQPRVLDFGIARVAHQQSDPHSGAGSPYYMAPEQMLREPTDRRADVYSLGVVLYELLTDVKPFRGETLKDIRNAVLTHEPPLACKVDKTVPKALAAIVARAMARDPEQRFRSARSFARELRQWLDANPVAPESDALPMAALPMPVAPPRRRVSLAWVAASVVIAALGSIVVWQNLRPGAASLETATVAPATPVLTAPTMGATAAASTPAFTALPLAKAEPSGGTGLVPTAPAASESGSNDGAGYATPPSALDAAPATAAAATTATSLNAHDLAVPTREPVVAPMATAPTRRVVSGATPLGSIVPGRESAKDRRQRESREREQRERELRLANAPIAVATGTVRIAVSPWGQVEVDGAATGAAPPLTELTLPEGRHQIVVRNGDYAPYVSLVDVTAGQVQSLRYKFGS